MWEVACIIFRSDSTPIVVIFGYSYLSVDKIQTVHYPITDMPPYSVMVDEIQGNQECCSMWLFIGPAKRCMVHCSLSSYPHAHKQPHLMYRIVAIFLCMLKLNIRN